MASLETCPTNAHRGGFLEALATGFLYYSCTTLVALAGFWFAYELLVPHIIGIYDADFAQLLACVDGKYYAGILSDGYSYEPDKPISVYIVAGNLLWRLPTPLSAALLAICAVLLVTSATLMPLSWIFL